MQAGKSAEEKKKTKDELELRLKLLSAMEEKMEDDGEHSLYTACNPIPARSLTAVPFSSRDSFSFPKARKHMVCGCFQRRPLSSLQHQILLPGGQSPCPDVKNAAAAT